MHLSCLARCWANLPEGLPPADVRERMLARIATYRSADGGFSTEPGDDVGSAYGAFVALGAYQDLRAPVPDAEGLARSIRSLVTADGGRAELRETPGGGLDAVLVLQARS